MHPDDIVKLLQDNRKFRARTLIEVPLDPKNVWLTKQALKFQGDLSSEAAATRRSRVECWSAPIIGFRNDTLDTFEVEIFSFSFFLIFRYLSYLLIDNREEYFSKAMWQKEPPVKKVEAPHENIKGRKTLTRKREDDPLMCLFPKKRGLIIRKNSCWMQFLKTTERKGYPERGFRDPDKNSGTTIWSFF